MPARKRFIVYRKKETLEPDSGVLLFILLVKSSYIQIKLKYLLTKKELLKGADMLKRHNQFIIKIRGEQYGIF